MQNLEKEIKEVGAGTVGINIAMFTILYSWLLMRFKQILAVFYSPKNKYQLNFCGFYRIIF